VQKLKLLIASASQGHYGGIEAFVLALASAAANWPEFDLQVGFKLVKGFEWRDDLKTAAATLPCPVHYFSRGDSRLFQSIRHADIIHGQNTSPDIAFPAKLLGKKLVLTIHNWRRNKPGIQYLLWGLGAKLADRRWYNSKFVWNTWEPGTKSKGSDCVPTVCKFPQAWCPPAERKGFLFIGRWIENKGLEELISAYSRSRLDPVQHPLILVGDGPLKARVTSLVAELGVRGVEMPGFLDDQNKAKRLASARWLVAPARTREDLGLTPIEARSVGVPVIVTRDGGLPEAGGEAALIVEPGNIEELSAALVKAASMNEVEYCDRAERGRETLKTFLRPMSFYRESYASLCQRGNKAAAA
jgi:glycosyltransferase involved in cell wall biosynthesis